MNKEHNCVIDGLKAICIVLVVITHCGWFLEYGYYEYTASHIKHPLMIFVVDMAMPVFMVISGYTYELCYRKRAFQFQDYYRSWAIRKIIEYTIPVIPVIIIYGAINRDAKLSTISWILMANFGSGAYYFIVLLQMVLFFPLIHNFMRKRRMGFIIICIVQILFEVLFHELNWSAALYRISLFRYLIFIILGILIYNRPKLSGKCLLISFCLGSLWLLSYNYWGYQLKLFTWWTWSAFPVAAYVFPVVYKVLVNETNKKMCQEKWRWLAFIGCKSYYIYAFQMAYFSLAIHNYLRENYGMLLSVLTSCILCVSGGCCTIICFGLYNVG